MLLFHCGLITCSFRTAYRAALITARSPVARLADVLMDSKPASSNTRLTLLWASC